MVRRRWRSIVCLSAVFGIISCCFPGSAAAEDGSEGGAPVYSSEDFDRNTREKSHFVMFFAPWCAHCKRLSPVWNELANRYNKDDPNSQRILIAKVDCSVETALCAEQDIKSYPSMKYFIAKSKKTKVYRWNRDIYSLQAYIEEKLAQEEAGIEYEDDESEDEFEEAVQGTVEELTDKTFEKHTERGKHFVLFFVNWCPHCQRLLPLWSELAGKFVDDENKVSFAKIDCTKYKRVCMDQKVQAYPTLVWFSVGKKAHEYSNERSIEKMMDYVEKMIEIDDVDAYREDGIIPGDHDVEAVFELNQKSFDSMIGEGFVFVKFYVPWCDYCKKLAPVWDDLARRVLNVEKLSIAKVDCTENQDICNQHKVQSYPTLLLFQAGTQIAVYSGSQEINDLRKFVLEHLHRHELHDEL